jgi:hypothetical protein
LDLNGGTLATIVCLDLTKVAVMHGATATKSSREQNAIDLMRRRRGVTADAKLLQ